MVDPPPPHPSPPPPPPNNVSIHIWWFQPNKGQPKSRSTHFSLHTLQGFQPNKFQPAHMVVSTQQISAYTHGGFNPTNVSLYQGQPISAYIQGFQPNKFQPTHMVVSIQQLSAYTHEGFILTQLVSAYKEGV